MYKIVISRENDVGRIERDNWKDLISSLVLCGFEVYGGEDELAFELGHDDTVIEFEKE